MKKYKTCLINIKTILDKKQQKYHKIRKNSYFYFPKLYKIFILYNCLVLLRPFGSLRALFYGRSEPPHPSPLPSFAPTLIFDRASRDLLGTESLRDSYLAFGRCPLLRVRRPISAPKECGAAAPLSTASPSHFATRFAAAYALAGRAGTPIANEKSRDGRPDSLLW